MAPLEDINHNTSVEEGTKPLLKTAAKGALFGVVGSIGGKVLGLVLQVLVSRLYGPKYFGLFITGLLACQILQSISALGLQKGGMRYLAIAYEKGQFHRMNDIFKTAVIFPLLVGIFSGWMFYTLAPAIAVRCFKDAEMVNVLRVFSLVIPFFSLLRIGADLSRAFKTTKFAVLVEDLLFYFLQIVFFLVLHAFGKGFLSVVFSFALSAGLCSVLMLCVVWHQIYQIKDPQPAKQQSKLFDFFPINWRPVLSYSIPLMPMGLLLIAGSSTDIIMLNILTDSSRVGEYAAAARWLFFFTFIFRPLNLIFAPLMAGQIGLNRSDHVHLLYSSGTRWLFLITLVAVVFQMLASEPLMMIFGKEFLNFAPKVLCILLIGTLSIALANVAGNLLAMSGHQNQELGCLGGMILWNIFLNLLWIPKYNVIGAAAATSTSHILINMVRISVVFKYLKLHPFSRHFIVPFLTCLVLCIGGLAFYKMTQPGMVIQVFLAVTAAVIVLIAVLLKGIDSHDREILIAIKRRVPIFNQKNRTNNMNRQER